MFVTLTIGPVYNLTMWTMYTIRHLASVVNSMLVLVSFPVPQFNVENVGIGQP